MERIAGVVCLVLAAVVVLANLPTTLSQGPALSDPSGLGVSRTVGVFLIPLLLVIVALKLFQKPKRGS